MQNKIATAGMRSEKILHEKKIAHPQLKNQIVGPLLVGLHAECCNILNSCILCYLYRVCNISLFTNSTVYFIKKAKENKI